MRVGDKVRITIESGRFCHCFSVGTICEVVSVDGSDNTIDVRGFELGFGTILQWVGMEEVELVV